MAIFDAHAYLSGSPFSNQMKDRDAVLQTMQRYGISGTALISGLGANCDFVTGNKRVREAVDIASGLYGYVILNADYPDESMEEQRRYLGRREFLAGLLYGHQGNPVTLENAAEILNAHRRYTKPMAISVPDAEAVREARHIAAEFSAMKFIWLGMGGEGWRGAVAAAKQYLNIYLEVSGSLDADRVVQAAATLTPRKLLFGSGMPYRDPELTIGLVESASTLTSADRRRIFFHNTVSLLGVEMNAE